MKISKVTEYAALKDHCICFAIYPIVSTVMFKTIAIFSYKTFTNGVFQAISLVANIDKN